MASTLNLSFLLIIPTLLFNFPCRSSIPTISFSVLAQIFGFEENSAVSSQVIFYNFPTFVSFVADIFNYPQTRMAGILTGVFASFPFVVGSIQEGMRAAFSKKLTETEFEELLESFQNRKNTAWNRWGSSLPFHPLTRQLRTILQEILWNGHRSLKLREEGFNAIEKLISYGPSYTKILAMQALFSLAAMDHPSDLAKICATHPFSTEELFQRLALKGRALHLLQKFSTFNPKEKKDWPFTLYARYFSSALGVSPSTLENLTWTLYGILILYTQLKLLEHIIRNMVQAFNCQSVRGATFSGFANEQGALPEACLEVYLGNLGIPSVKPPMFGPGRAS